MFADLVRAGVEAYGVQGMRVEIVGTGGGCTAVQVTHPDLPGVEVLITNGDAAVPSADLYPQRDDYDTEGAWDRAMAAYGGQVWIGAYVEGDDPEAPQTFPAPEWQHATRDAHVIGAHAVAALLATRHGDCPVCGDRADYCQGHGVIGDPIGAAILANHDDGDHSHCHGAGCETAREDLRGHIFGHNGAPVPSLSCCDATAPDGPCHVCGAPAVEVLSFPNMPWAGSFPVCAAHEDDDPFDPEEI